MIIAEIITMFIKSICNLMRKMPIVASIFIFASIAGAILGCGGGQDLDIASNDQELQEPSGGDSTQNPQEIPGPDTPGPDGENGDQGSQGGGEVDLSGYCGDEAEFADEVQQELNVTVDQADGHLLLTPIKLDMNTGLDAATIDSDGMRVTLDGETVDFTAASESSDGGTVIAIRYGATGELGWQPSKTYQIKLCHQIRTVDEKPIKPIQLFINTREPDVSEDIGIYHSNATRSGVFYLPKEFDSAKEYPLALLLHGLGASGASMVSEFHQLADDYDIILLAPDGFLRKNPFANGATYYFNPEEGTSEDYEFVNSCIQKIAAAFQIDYDYVLSAGFSMGAPASLYFSTHEDMFTHGAMLHGVVWNYDGNWEMVSIGDNRPKFWYSTSVADWVTNYDLIPLPVNAETWDIPYLESAIPPLELTKKINYPGGHSLSSDEKEDLINWFLLGHAPNP